MSESKEIPAAILSAAEAAIAKNKYWPEWMAIDVAKAALEAAGVAAMVADRERIGLALFQNGYDDGFTTDGAIEAIEMMAVRIAELEAGIAKMQARPTTAELFSAGVV